MSVSIGFTSISGITTSVDQYDAVHKGYFDSVNNITIPSQNQKNTFLFTDATTTSWVGITSFTEYTIPGTYIFNIPEQAKELTFFLVGAGGGGAGGISGPANNFGFGVGGGGGGGGATAMWIIPRTSIVGSAITVSIGSSGTAGAGSPASSVTATPGGTGGSTSVTWSAPSGIPSATCQILVNGGVGGFIGTSGSIGGSAGGGAAAPPIASNYTYASAGTPGGRGAYAGGSLPASPGTPMSSPYQCSGGGGGGSNAGSSLVPGAGGAIYYYNNTYQITTADASALVIPGLSHGAGGAGGQGSQYAANSGGRGARGGGGGGGGSGQGQNLGFPASGYTSGPGGAGGAGYAFIMWRG